MESSKERSALLKKRLQQKLQAQTFFTEDVSACVELLTAFQEAGINYKIAGWVNVKQELRSYLVPEFEKLGFALDDDNNLVVADILDQVFETYPSIHSFRYVPPVPELNSLEQRDALFEAMEYLNLQDQEVQVYWLRYAVVLKLNLLDLLKLPADSVFTGWHGDAVIFPENLRWLIAYSLEDLWYAGSGPDKGENAGEA